MKPIDMTPIIKKYPGYFVALSNDRKKVLGLGMTPEEAINQAKKNGFENPIISKIPRQTEDYKAWER
jgi:hypothetical protein